MIIGMENNSSKGKVSQAYDEGACNIATIKWFNYLSHLNYLHTCWSLHLDIPFWLKVAQIKFAYLTIPAAVFMALILPPNSMWRACMVRDICDSYLYFVYGLILLY